MGEIAPGTFSGVALAPKCVCVCNLLLTFKPIKVELKTSSALQEN